MKAKLIVLCGIGMLALFPITSSAGVGDISVGGMLGIATSPGDTDMGTGYGLLVGGGYQFMEGLIAGKEDGVEGRFEIGYFTWSKDVSPGLGFPSVELKVTDTPLYFLGRYIYPINEEFKVYGEAGLSINLWEAEVGLPQICDPYPPYTCYGGGKAKASDTEIGFAIGGGCEYYISPTFSIGGDLRYNAFSDGSHLILMALANYHILNAIPLPQKESVKEKPAPAAKPAPKKRR